jgi:hypothetical protein
MNYIKKGFKNEENLYLSLGFWYLFLQIIVLIENHYVYKYNIFFWFCDQAPILFSIGFFTRSKKFIKSIINFGLLVQFFWVSDFLLKILFHAKALGITNYLFEPQLGNFVIVPLLVHITSTNLALFITYKEKPTKKVLVYSAVYIVFLYALTLAYTPVANNVNCVYEICGLPQFTFSYYTALWPVLAFLVVILPTQGIQYMLYKWAQKRKYKH